MTTTTPTPHTKPAARRTPWRTLAALTLAIATLTAGAATNPATAEQADETTPAATTPARATTTLTDDGTPQHITINAALQTSLDGHTVSLRRIGHVVDGHLEADTPTTRQAAAQAGGQGDNPVQDLFQRLLDWTLTTTQTAPTIHAALKDTKPDATITGAGTLTVPAGWYLASVDDLADSTPQLVYTGGSQSNVIAQMLQATATIDGQPQPLEFKPDPNAISTMSLGRATVTYDPTGFTIPGGSQNTANFDFTFNDPTIGNPAAFCLDPGAPQADSGASYTRHNVNDQNLRTILWYGHRGPNSIYDPANENTWGQHATADARTASSATHLAASAYFMRRDPNNPNWAGIPNNAVHALAGYDSLIWLTRNHPLSPVVDYQVFYLTANAGSTHTGNWYDLNTGTYQPGFTLTQDDGVQGSRMQVLISSEFHRTRIDVATQAIATGVDDTHRAGTIADHTIITPRRLDPVNTNGGIAAGSQLAVTYWFHYQPDKGGMKQAYKSIVVNFFRDVPQDTDYTYDGPTFSPKDLGMSEWEDGHYWFDVYFDTWYQPGSNPPTSGPNNRHFVSNLDFNNWTYTGKDDPKEQLDLTGGTQLTLTANKTWNKGNSNTQITTFSAHLTGPGVNQTKHAIQKGNDPTKGTITFDPIHYTPADLAGKDTITRTYTLTETQGKTGGIKYDTTKHTITVTIKKTGHTLTATPNYDNKGTTPTTIVNSYITPPAYATLTATKTFDGDDLSDRNLQDFTFTLHNGTDGKGTALQTVKAGKDGKVTFDPIPYTSYDLKGGRTRTFDYSIKETRRAGDGVQYDAHTAVWHVTLTDDGNGHLTATPRADTDPAHTTRFTNRYKPAPTAVTPRATKVFTGKEHSRTDITTFAFTIRATDKDGNPTGAPLQTAHPAKDGSITFQPIRYDHDDMAGKDTLVRTYAIQEAKGNAGGVTYTDKTARFTVTITDDGYGQLHAALTQPAGQTTTFTNEYKPKPTKATPQARKTYTMAGKPVAMADGKFKFQLKEGTDGNGRPVSQAASRSDGTVTFPAIDYDRTGVHHYTITEINGGEGRVNYDRTIRHLTVTITDDGYGQLHAALAYDDGDTKPAQFANTTSSAFTMPITGGLVDTGLAIRNATIAALTILTMAAAATIAIRTRRAGNRRH